jgi:hypothetical protein
VTEQDRSPHADRGDQLPDVLDMPLEVVSSGRLVTEPVTSEIDTDEVDRRRESRGERSERVPHARRPMDGDDRWFATRPVDDVKCHVLQGDTGHMFLYIVDGSGAMETEGQVRTASAGQVIHQLPGKPMIMKNASTSAPLKFILFQVGPKGPHLTVPVK